jgi:hypothetical protein
MNGKPRIPRLQFLDGAWRRRLLDRALWSFGYYPEKVERAPNQYLSIGHRSYSVDVAHQDQYQEFLNAHEWPRILLSDTIDFDMLFATPTELMGKVNWEVIIETVVTKPGDPLGALDRTTMITEKFYKAIIMGNPVIPIGWQGCHRDIGRAGYKLPDVDFDHLDQIHWQDRLEGSLDLLEQLGDRQSFRNSALANFEQLIDQDQLVRDVCEPLLHIREHPSFKAY